MVKITRDETKGPYQVYFAQLTDIDLADNYNFGYGATPEEAADNLKARVNGYIKYLQGADYTILGIR
jgi:hypothetical protein